MDKINPGAEAAAAEAESRDAEVEQAALADEVVVIEEDKETGKVTVSTAEQQEEVEQTQQDNNLGEDQLKVTKYKTYEDFQISAIAIVGSARATVEQIQQLPDISDVIIDQVDQQLVVINELIETEFQEQDSQGQYEELFELKFELEEIKFNKFKSEVETLVNSFPEGIFTGELEGADTAERVENVALKIAALISDDSEQQQKIKELIVSRINGTDLEGVKKTIDAKTGEGNINPDVVDANLVDLENEEIDVGKKKEITSVRKLLKMIGYSSVALGIVANTIFDKGKVSVDDLVSFLLNPVRPTRSYDSSSTKEKGETIPSHEFKSKFANPAEAGKALVITSKVLQEQNKFKTWRTDNISELRKLEDNPKGNESSTHALFVSLDKVALADMVADRDANWDLFSDAYASAMFGSGATLDKDSREFLKEQLKNDGEKLKLYWNIGDIGSSPEQEPTQSDSAGGEGNADTVKPGEQDSNLDSINDSSADTNQASAS